MRVVECGHDSVGIESERRQQAIGFGVRQELRRHSENVDEALLVASVNLGRDRHSDTTFADAVLDGDDPLMAGGVLAHGRVQRRAGANIPDGGRNTSLAQHVRGLDRRGDHLAHGENRE